MFEIAQRASKIAWKFSGDVFGGCAGTRIKICLFRVLVLIDWQLIICKNLVTIC